MEKCENFKNVFEIVFDSNYSKFIKFKAKHYQEGEFTDEEGVIVLATGYYLGVTLRIFSRSNTKIQPYTEYNKNQPIVFNIFLDDRNRNSEHFQSLKEPKAGNSSPDKDSHGDTFNKKSSTSTKVGSSSPTSYGIRCNTNSGKND